MKNNKITLEAIEQDGKEVIFKLKSNYDRR